MSIQRKDLSNTTNGELRINDDLVVFVSFDSAAIRPLFYLSLQYKGMEILPYSYFVDYYYADIHDIANYTRRYEADCSSWAYAFEFVMNISEKVKIEGNLFVEEMLKDELNKLIEGLRFMIANPMRYLDRMVNERKRENEAHYYSVRQMTSDEEMECRAYPHEMMFILMAEKVSGALAFIEGIMRFEKIDSSLRGVSAEIINLSKKLYPALEKKISSLKEEVIVLQNQEDALNTKIYNLQEMICSNSKANADCPDLIRDLQRANANRADICWERCKRMNHITRLEECRITLDHYKYPYMQSIR